MTRTRALGLQLMTEANLGGRGVAVLIAYRLRWALAAIVGLVVGSSVGYVVLERYSWLDALYMTIITLGTVGYGEVRPIHTRGRLLTMSVIVASFATLVYMASVLTNVFASGEVTRHVQARRARRMCEELDNHVIVVGFGRVGQAVIRAFHDRGKQCVVMDTNPDHGPDIIATGAMQIIGNATDEDDLRRAGIERADALVAAADQDSENLVVVLTARSLRPDIRIVSRVNQKTWLRRIKQAGADVAESPYESYGARLADSAIASDSEST
ncbi:MAG: NAD-binding protein [Acidimicrobiales bacterium]